MTESNKDGVVIGWREIYDAVMRLDSKLDEHIASQAAKQATLELRVRQLEDAAKESRAEGQHGKNRNWALWAAVVAAFLTAVIPLLLNHH